MERFLNNLEDSLAEEQGFSTVGVALALLLSFALIFSAARVYEIESVSGDIQNVADSAALAAENVVGEYCVIATMRRGRLIALALFSLRSGTFGCSRLHATHRRPIASTPQKRTEAQASARFILGKGHLSTRRAQAHAPTRSSC